MKNWSSFPYINDVGVICLVPNVWGGPWQARHQLLTRLSRYFNIVWCNPVGWHKLWLHGTPTSQDAVFDGALPPGFTTYSPGKWFPEVARPRFLADWTMRGRLRQARRTLLARGCRKTILYLWLPRYAPALDLIDCDLSCYHIDDEYTFSKVEKPVEDREAKLISRVDQVFIHSPALLEKKGHLNPQTTFVPNGVDFLAYATPHDEPADLKPIPHPRIGYVGIIKTQLDISLLKALAQRHPKWSFVLVGPQGNIAQEAVSIQELSQMPNVYFLGRKPVDMLPAYTQHLDVCIMCYKINDYTKFIYPLKLHEYLASGRPVVSSPIRSLQEFAHIIRLARTTDEWSESLSYSLAPAARSATQVQARQSVAREHDWNKLTTLIARVICSRLGPSYLERFEKIPPPEPALLPAQVT